jgi:hypothetical protein|nr:MAG TPA: Exodeoxyribonuclease 8 [Caudoviricetes sp.]
MKIEIPYYEDNTRISNSAIGWFLKKGPRYYQDMLDGKEEGITGKFLERGTMIHMYLLQPEDFWDNYVILDYEVPKVKQQKDFCDEYANLKALNPIEDEDKILLEAYNKAYSNKLSDDKKLITAKELVIQYKDYLKSKDTQTKTVISFADLNMLKTIKENVDSHKKASILLNNMPSCECNNEFHINWESPKVGDEGVSLPCKSLLDRVIFDHINQKITLIDLKTTSDVYNFKHSVELFDYYRQIAFYLLAITWYMLDQGIDVSNYDFEAYIVAIQTNGKYEVRVFNMYDEQEIMDRKDLILKVLSELSYHYQTGNWDHTRSYYEGDGTEKLE